VPRMKKHARVTTTSVDPYVENLLQRISEGKRILNAQKGDKVFSQGELADAIFLFRPAK